MPVATARTISLQGAMGHLVDVQVDVSQGVVATALVGRPDASISEGRDRCRMAIQNSGFEWPSTKRVTILLSPADLPKSGPHFDLAMALGVLVASRQVVPVDTALEDNVFIGELTLDGRLRPVPGVLPMVLAASARGLKRVFVPQSQAGEARMVPGVDVLGMRSLGQVVAELLGEPVPDAPPVEPISGSRLLAWRGEDRITDVDLADLVGMDDARYALEVAAAGGHHLLLSGPKGTGKTSLAERLPGLLPDLTLEESLEVTAILSLACALDATPSLATRPPFVAPHSTASRSSVLGGGTGRVRPGDISRAHCGVLFLDEFPHFQSDVVEALRQPLESGEITIGRGDETATFPARGMVVLAANPCPCGNYTPDVSKSWCDCKEVTRREYRRKLQGPVVDRVDIVRHVRNEVRRPSPVDVAESSAVVRERVEAARARQLARYAEFGWRTNGQAPGPRLRELFPLTPAATLMIDDEVYQGRLSRRGGTRVHRLAWTVADLRGVAVPGTAEAEVALALRHGGPLRVDWLRRRAG